jgi:hypothetical protein
MTPVAIVLALGAGVVLLVMAVLASQRKHEPSGPSVLRLPTDASGRHLVISDKDGVTIASVDGLPTLAGRFGAYNVYAKDELGATYILLMPHRGEGNLWPT